MITQVTQIYEMHQVHVTFNLLCKDLEPENSENPELNRKCVRSHTIINIMKLILIIGHLKSAKELLQVKALSRYHHWYKAKLVRIHLQGKEQTWQMTSLATDELMSGSIFTRYFCTPPPVSSVSAFGTALANFDPPESP